MRTNNTKDDNSDLQRGIYNEPFTNKSGESTVKYLTRTEAARLLRISIPTLRQYIRKGIIPAYQIGSVTRLREEDIVSAVQSNPAQKTLDI